MTVQEITRLFAYTEWANARMFASAATLETDELTRPRGSSFASIRDTIAHIVVAEWLWLQRWKGINPSAAPDWVDVAELGTLATKLAKIEVERCEFLGTLTDGKLSQALTYSNLKGETATQAFGDLCSHVVNHSTYHRGQVATMLRQAGATPPATDLLLFNRDKSA